MKRILFIGAHTDDIESGAGATLHKMVDEGAEIHCLTFSDCHQPTILKLEHAESMGLLGVDGYHLRVLSIPVRRFGEHRQNILDALIFARGGISPDVVFTHSLKDIHQDHEVVARETLRAFKHTTIYGYELAQNTLNFTNTCFSKISVADLDVKCAALACYKSQAGRPYMHPDFVKAQAVVRGMQAGVSLAEVFEVIRLFV